MNNTMSVKTLDTSFLNTFPAITGRGFGGLFDFVVIKNYKNGLKVIDTVEFRCERLHQTLEWLIDGHKRCRHLYDHCCAFDYEMLLWFLYGPTYRDLIDLEGEESNYPELKELKECVRMWDEILKSGYELSRMKAILERRLGSFYELQQKYLTDSNKPDVPKNQCPWRCGEKHMDEILREVIGAPILSYLAESDHAPVDLYVKSLPVMMTSVAYGAFVFLRPVAFTTKTKGVIYIENPCIPSKQSTHAAEKNLRTYLSYLSDALTSVEYLRNDNNQPCRYLDIVGDHDQLYEELTFRLCTAARQPLYAYREGMGITNRQPSVQHSMFETIVQSDPEHIYPVWGKGGSALTREHQELENIWKKKFDELSISLGREPFNEEVATSLSKSTYGRLLELRKMNQEERDQVMEMEELNQEDRAVIDQLFAGLDHITYNPFTSIEHLNAINLNPNDRKMAADVME